MKKEHASLLATVVPVLLVLAGAAMVRGENVFTDDFKGDGDKARFVIEAEHYSSRSRPTSEGWWEVDGGSHRFIEGPSDGKDAPTADSLRAGEDAAGEDTVGEESSYAHELPEGLTLRLSRDLDVAADQLRGAAADGWEPREELLLAWEEGFRGRNENILERLLAACEE